MWVTFALVSIMSALKFKDLHMEKARHSSTPSFEFAIHDDSVARCAISENGQFLYINERLQDLLHIDGAATALHADDVLKLDDNRSILQAEEGPTEVIIGPHNIPVYFHINWMINDQNDHVLVASEMYEDDEYRAFENPFSGTNEPPQTPATLSTTDTHPARPYNANPPPYTDNNGVDETNHSYGSPRLYDAAHNPVYGSIDPTTDFPPMTELCPDIMLVSDRQGNILRANHHFYTKLGQTHDAVKNSNFMDMFPYEERQRLRTFLQTHLSERGEMQEPVGFDSYILSDNGQFLYIEWSQKIQNNMVYTVGRDVSAIKKHEQELSRREKQLSRAEKIGHMGHWRWMMGQDDIECSDQVLEIFGLGGTRPDAHETFGSSPSKPSIPLLNQMVHKRDLGRVLHAFQRAMIEENAYEIEFRIRDNNGHTKYVRCEGRCEHDEEGEVIALYGVLQDMTERWLYEAELREAKNAAERSYAAKSQFLANMSHELRTPLNAIIGFSEMMEHQLLGPLGSEKYLDYIGGIRESGEHLLDLINDILDMSKIEAGKHELALEDLNVIKIIKLAAHMMEGRAFDAKVAINLSELPDDDMTITADRRAIMQIMLNLLSNAVKFTGENGLISILCEPREENILIKVIDNGIGIPANKLSNITNPFEQACSSYSRNHNGSGLGLAITKELVRLHKGRMKIQSEVGEGTTVSIWLPYYIDSAIPHAAE